MNAIQMHSLTWSEFQGCSVLASLALVQMYIHRQGFLLTVLGAVVLVPLKASLLQVHRKLSVAERTESPEYFASFPYYRSLKEDVLENVI